MNSRFRLFRDLDSDGDGTLSYKVRVPLPGCPDPNDPCPRAHLARQEGFSSDASRPQLFSFPSRRWRRD